MRVFKYLILEKRVSVNMDLSNYNAQLAYSRMASFVNSVSYPTTVKSNTYEGITDSIKLSSQSISAFSREWITSQLDKVATKNEANEYKTSDEISLNYAEKLAGFASNVRKMLYNSDVTLEEQINIQTDGIGHIVSTDTERDDSVEINSVLRKSIDLTSEFMEIAASESIVNHLNEAPDFIQDYAENPKKTLQNNENTLRRYILEFQLSVGSQEVTTERVDPLYY